MPRHHIHFGCRIKKRRSGRIALEAVCGRKSKQYSFLLSQVTCPHCWAEIDEAIGALQWLIFESRYVGMRRNNQLSENASPSVWKEFEIRPDEPLRDSRDVFLGVIWDNTPTFTSNEITLIGFRHKDRFVVIGRGILLVDIFALLYRAYVSRDHGTFAAILRIEQRHTIYSK